MIRYIYKSVLKDLKKKMVFITGPRQVGKTFLAKDLQKEFKTSMYLNNDDLEDAKIIKKRTWPLNTNLIIFDEIHKMPNWKNYLKGIFDTRSKNQTFLVTGSGRLDTFRQTGDSLAGRYFLYRLNPFSVKELSSKMTPYEALETLNNLGGFPEPFLSGSSDEASRWRKQYYTDMLREDILDFTNITEIRTINILIEMLRERVGSPLSFTQISRDLQVSPNTVIKYINILESLNIIFIIRPYHKNIARSLLKEPKIYFYDSGYVKGNDGKNLENTVAVCLLKHIQYLTDTKGKDISLHYVRTKDDREIDFAISEDSKLKSFIEVKLSDISCSKNIKYFKEKYSNVQAIQLVHNLKHEQEMNNVSILHAGNWLSKLSA